MVFNNVCLCVLSRCNAQDYVMTSGLPACHSDLSHPDSMLPTKISRNGLKICFPVNKAYETSILIGLFLRWYLQCVPSHSCYKLCILLLYCCTALHVLIHYLQHTLQIIVCIHPFWAPGQVLRGSSQNCMPLCPLSSLFCFCVLGVRVETYHCGYKCFWPFGG